VENHHVSHQSRYRSTRQFKKRSSDGISICTASTQKEIEGGKRLVQEKSRKQQRAKWSILGQIQRCIRVQQRKIQRPEAQQEDNSVGKRRKPHKKHK
jgi:hypothetical protein